MPQTPEERIEDLERRVRKLEDQIKQIPGMIGSSEKKLTDQIDAIRNPKRKGESLADIAKKKGGKLY